MSKLIVANVCLEKIEALPDELKREFNGRHYVNVVIAENYDGKDERGNTHAVFVSQKVGEDAETHQAIYKKHYLGNGKQK